MRVIKAAIGDAVLTFMWVFCVSSLRALTSAIASAFSIQGPATILITILLLFVFLFLFSFIGDALGGASFNPTGTAAFYAAGLGSENLISMASRFPAQAAGAVGGALAIMEVMPKQYKHMLGGPSLKVDIQTAAIVEGILTFTANFVVLFVILKGPRSRLIKMWLLSMSTVTLVISGSSYTGPSMNPANAFGWAYVKQWHDTWEQLYVYWILPFAGAILAGWLFRMIFPPPTPKQKTV